MLLRDYDVNVALVLMALTAFYPTLLITVALARLQCVQHGCFLPMTMAAANCLRKCHHKKARGRSRKLVQHPALNQTKHGSVRLCSASREVISATAISTQAPFITLLTQAVVHLLGFLHRGDYSFSPVLTRKKTTS